MKANFQSLIKLNYRLLFSCFDYIPLSFECTDPEAYNTGLYTSGSVHSKHATD